MTDTTSAKLIDGKALAASIRQDLKEEIADLSSEDPSLVPGLAVVLVGEDPASQVYVRNKAKQTVEVGMKSIEHKLPAETSQTDLLELVNSLNQDTSIDGILVQLPLPDHIDPDTVINAIDPAKDVDGFHVVNSGRLMTGQDSLVPCTPLGCTLLIEQAMRELATDGAAPNGPSGLHAVVVGRSNIVGKPMAHLLLQANCTVTIAHSRTKNLPEVCRSADILVAAVGRPEMIKGDWVKPGAIVIDVGINRIEGPDGKTRLVGDVATQDATTRAAAITPVPGGVGPMTIACLLKNTMTAALKRRR